MRFLCEGSPRELAVTHATVAGWTGRDPAAIAHHIEELAAIGVAPPSTVPLYYRVAAGLLTQAATIEVLGAGTSGEVEPLLLWDGERLFLGLGSDHTDRDLEAHSVAASKQACAKPVGPMLWALDAVANHLDRIELRSWIREGGDWVLYQDGRLDAIRPLGELIAGAGLREVPLSPGAVAALFCGTLGARGGVRPASAFRMELRDPVLDRTIAHTYETVTLPIVA